MKSEALNLVSHTKDCGMTVTVLTPTLGQSLNFVQNNSIHLPMNVGAEKLPKVEVQLLSGIVVNYSGELFDSEPSVVFVRRYHSS